MKSPGSSFRSEQWPLDELHRGLRGGEYLAALHELGFEPAAARLCVRRVGPASGGDGYAGARLRRRAFFRLAGRPTGFRFAR